VAAATAASTETHPQPLTAAMLLGSALSAMSAEQALSAVPPMKRELEAVPSSSSGSTTSATETLMAVLEKLPAGSDSKTTAATTVAANEDALGKSASTKLSSGGSKKGKAEGKTSGLGIFRFGRSKAA